MTEYYFDEAAADAACDFFPRYLRFTKGKFAGRPFELQPWQRDQIIRPLFGWKRKGSGLRRYRRAYVEVPKKNGKTELAAGISLLLLIGDGELGAEGYFIATKAEQANICFNAATAMVQFSPELQEHLTAFKTKIICPELSGTLVPLSGSPKGKHGKNPSFIIGDEVHEWADGDLYQFLNTGMAAREQPLEFLITTSGESVGFGYEMHKWASKVAAGVIEDPETLIVIYGVPMEADWRDRELWKAANPNYGVSVQPDYLDFKFRETADDDLKEADFRRFHLNQWMKQAKFWLKPELWEHCSHPDEDHVAAIAELTHDPASGPMMTYRKPVERWREFFERMRGREAFVGIDLSSTEDVTAVIWVFPPSGDDHRTTVACRFYIPEDNIERRVKLHGVPYLEWVKAEAVTLTDGNTVDQERIFDDLIEDAEQFCVRRVGYDKWGSAWIGPKLVEHFGDDDDGNPIVLKVQQGYATMSPGAKELERLMLACLLDHGGHPVLKWMASNVVIKMGEQGDIVPIKSKSTEKIDGIVATIIALSCQVLEALPEDNTIEVHDIVVFG